MNCTMKTLIAASLLLNLLLAGFILGHAGRTMMGDHLHASIHDVALTLPEEKRAQFEKVMGRAEKDTTALFAQLEASRGKATKLLKAEPFDKNAFLAQMKIMESTHAQLKDRLAKAIVQVAQDLTPEERVHVAELLRRPPPPPGGQHEAPPRP